MAKDGVLVIKDILNEYSEDIQEEITHSAERIAKDGVAELKVTSPKRKNSGKYAKSWIVKTEKGRGFVSCTIHNKQYQLTHLLEKGHRILNRHGEYKGDVDAKVHISPVEQKCIKQYEKDVEKIIKNGG